MMPRLGTRVALLAAMVMLVVLIHSGTPPVSAQGPGIHGPFSGPPARAVSFDGDVRRLPKTLPSGIGTVLPVGALPGGSFGPASSDPARQTRQGPAAMPAPIQNFKGLDKATWGAGWPPDTNGDVGPNHYIQTVNTSIGIFNKTGTQLAAFTFNTFFDGTGTPCDTANQGDPVVLYDPLADRWVITDFAWANFLTGPWYECIAVSKTSDPVSGGWWQYGMVAHNTFFADYPKLGVWADGYYMSANLYNATTGANQGVRVWALDRASMINGTLNEVHFDLSTSYFGLLPSNLRGSLPASGTPGFFLSAGVSSPDTVLKLWKFHVDWGNPASSTFTGPTVLTVGSYSYPSFSVPQLGTSQTLDTLGLRLMMQLQYRNIGGTESLWASHTTTSGGVTGVRWYEIRNPNGTPTVYQQSTFQPDSNYRWMPSLAIDHNGNMAIGYSVSSSSMYPAIRYAGRLASDPLSTLGQGETTLFAGTGSQTSTSRWGDYSAMTVDPVDDCTFWYTTEYYETTGILWQTRIGSFKFPSCTIPTNPTKLYLPMLLKNYTAPLVGAPTLNPIDNADGDGSYAVTWTTLPGADTYTLEEDDNGSFTSPTPVYIGAGTLWSTSGKYPATYYYRVKGTNAAGDSAWSNTQSVTVNPADWTIVVSTDFEGTFPSPWSVVDNDGATNGEYYWAKRDCRAFAGSFSGWGVGGGTDGAALTCGNNYPNMGSSWMSYGPFSLTGASAADLQFKLWLNSEQDHDSVCRYASADGIYFYGYCSSGNSGGWIDRSLDLGNVPGLGNLLGQPNVWVVIEFYRDLNTNYAEGGYVDNIVLRKCVGGVCLSGSSPVRLGGQLMDKPQMKKLPTR